MKYSNDPRFIQFIIHDKMLNLNLSEYFINNYNKTQKNKWKQNLYDLQNVKSQQESLTHSIPYLGEENCIQKRASVLKMNEPQKFMQIKMSRLELGFGIYG